MFKKNTAKLITGILLFTILSTLPASAANTGTAIKPGDGILDYGEIEEILLEQNLQIKLSKLALNKHKNHLDDVEESAEKGNEAAIGLLNRIAETSDLMDAIIQNSLDDPELMSLANAVKFALSLTEKNVRSQITDVDDRTDAVEGQIDAAELNLKQTEQAMLNTAKSLFVLYHQILNNIEKAENARSLVAKQLDLAYIKFKHGIIPHASVKEVEASLLEQEASCASLHHQRDALLMQIKGLMGISTDEKLALGEIPESDSTFIGNLDFKKDLEEALKNALSLKIRKQELDNADAGYSTEKYDLQLKKYDAELKFIRQYHAVLEKRDALLVSQNRLAAARAELELGKSQYAKGEMASIALQKLENDVKNQELTVESNKAALFYETEYYKAMKEGLL